jgi:CheY-like chemotaxis protein
MKSKPRKVLIFDDEHATSALSLPSQAKVLVLDEDYRGMHDLKDVIEEELGWTVVLSAEQNILQQLRTERFDLLLVDMMIHEKGFDAKDKVVENVSFPDVNWKRTGLEFLRRLRRGDYTGEDGAGTPADVPVMVLSAVASYSVGQDPSLDIGDYVEKPFRLADIVYKVQQLLKE